MGVQQVNVAAKVLGVSAPTVAEQILWLRRNEETTPMHLVKLVYLCHGWNLGIHGSPLISEPVEAWQYGPVIPSIYHAYKVFGGEPVTNPVVDQSKAFDSDQQQLIEAVLHAYREHSAIDLSSITHRKGTPWFDIYKGGRGLHRTIPNALIKSYYVNRIKKTHQE